VPQTFIGAWQRALNDLLRAPDTIGKERRLRSLAIRIRRVAWSRAQGQAQEIARVALTESNRLVDVLYGRRPDDQAQ
jgi:cystathionine beta-lyase/cystathionine gamma-synthase